MKFTIKTSAVALSDSKFAKRGEYETEDEKEIERLRNTAKKFPQDVEEVSGHGSKKKEEPKEEKEETATPQEETEYIASRIMGWKFFQEIIHHDDGFHGYNTSRNLWVESAPPYRGVENIKKVIEYEKWKPSTDWNQWREVEQKISEDRSLCDAYLSALKESTGSSWNCLADAIMKTDLPTRVAALIQAHSQLNP